MNWRVPLRTCTGRLSILVNRTGSAVMQKNIEALGAISYTEEEQAFAKKIQEANIEALAEVVGKDKAEKVYLAVRPETDQEE